MIEALPKGWVKTALGEIIQVNSGDGLTKKQMVPDGKVPVYGGNGIAGFHNKGNINNETIVIGRVGYYCGSVHLTAENAWVTDNAFITRFSEKNINKKFLFYLLSSTDLRINDSSTAQPVISGKKIYPIEILIPPRQEQKRIAEKLDCLLGKVKSCKAHLDKVPEIIKQFRQSVLADAVSGKLTEDWREENKHIKQFIEYFSQEIKLPNDYMRLRKQKSKENVNTDRCVFPELPEKWFYKNVEELYEKNIIIDYADGNHGSLYPRKSEFGDKGVLFVTAKQITKNGRVNKAECTYLNKDKAHKLVKGWAKDGDVLLTHNATVGRTAFAEDIGCEFLLGTSVTFYRLNKNYLDNKYFFYFLTSHLWQQQLNTIMEQTTRNQVSITKQAKFLIAAPPIEEQKEIVRRVEGLFLVADQLETKLSLARARVDILSSSTLSKAFRGELVPQDPNDEPAELLLNRIHAEQGALAANRKKGGRTAIIKSGRGKRSKPQQDDSETEPEPVAAVHIETVCKDEKYEKAKSRIQPVAQIAKRFERTEILQAFRKAIFLRTDLEKNTLLRLVGQRLGVQRLSKPIRHELQSYIRTAIRRKIIFRDGDGYNSATPTIHHYDDAYLIKVLRSIVRRGYEYERDNLVAGAAEYLGFDKVSDAFSERMKSVFRLAIRRGELYRNGIYVRKS